MNGWSRRGSYTDHLASALIGVTVTGRDIPEVPARLPSLREACDAAAAELVSTEHPELLVLLSGGADSTLAAAAISRLAEAAGKRVVYAVTPLGYADLDPRTVEWLSSAKGAEFEWYDGAKLDYYTGGLVVTGVLGDEMYAGWVGGEFGDLEDTVWGMTPSEFIARVSGLNQSAALTERYMPVFEGMPYSLTAPNMLHWLAFKYTWGRERQVITVSTGLGPPGGRYVHFFEALPIQHWMMHDMELRCGKTAETRKDVGIGLIREYVGADVAVPQKNRVMQEIVSGEPYLYDVFKVDADGTVHRRNDGAGKLYGK